MNADLGDLLLPLHVDTKDDDLVIEKADRARARVLGGRRIEALRERDELHVAGVALEEARAVEERELGGRLRAHVSRAVLDQLAADELLRRGVAGDVDGALGVDDDAAEGTEPLRVLEIQDAPVAERAIEDQLAAGGRAIDVVTELLLMIADPDRSVGRSGERQPGVRDLGRLDRGRGGVEPTELQRDEGPGDVDGLLRDESLEGWWLHRYVGALARGRRRRANRDRRAPRRRRRPALSVAPGPGGEHRQRRPPHERSPGATRLHRQGLRSPLATVNPRRGASTSEIDLRSDFDDLLGRSPRTRGAAKFLVQLSGLAERVDRRRSPARFAAARFPSGTRIRA